MPNTLGVWNEMLLIFNKVTKMSFAATTHTLLDHCAFEKANICGMIQGTRDDADWVHEDGTQLGQADHTLAGQCTGECGQRTNT